MREPNDCVPGRRASVELTVAEADTAIALGSGDLPVLGTPRVVALCEQAAVAALDDCLHESQTSVGSWVEVDHNAPTPIGGHVVAEAVLLGVHGRRLEFSVTVANGGEQEVARCRHRRVVVDRETFAQG
ncbi:MAG: thioesterase family protein [Actinomycetota bacterium]